MPAIDGLSSGLDTASIISQLMRLERVPQSRLKAEQTSAQSSIGTLRTLNTKFLSILTAAEKLGATPPAKAGAPAPPAKTSDWTPTTASSSDPARVTATAGTAAAAGVLVFNVKQLATSASHLSGDYAGKDAVLAPVTAPATQVSFVLTQGEKPSTTIHSDGTLGGTVSALNKANAGVTASLVQISGEGATAVYRMQVTSTTTGAGAISLQMTGAEANAPSLVPTEMVKGQDAQLDLGNGITVTRASNTISDVLEGVTLTLKKADTNAAAPGQPAVYTEAPTSVTVTKDTDGIAAKVQALVDAANTARKEAKDLTAADPVSKAKGRLYGDSSVRGLVDRVRSVFSQDTSALAAAGVTVDRSGVAQLDKTRFLEALAADPGKVEAALGRDGLAGRLHVLAHAVSRPASAEGGAGMLTSTITSKESQIDRLKDNIESWDRRLEMKEKQLQRQYTALETALGKAQSQGQWLSGQLANLPTWSR